MLQGFHKVLISFQWGFAFSSNSILHDSKHKLQANSEDSLPPSIKFGYSFFLLLRWHACGWTGYKFIRVVLPQLQYTLESMNTKHIAMCRKHFAMCREHFANRNVRVQPIFSNVSFLWCSQNSFCLLCKHYFAWESAYWNILSFSDSYKTITRQFFQKKLLTSLCIPG